MDDYNNNNNDNRGQEQSNQPYPPNFYGAPPPEPQSPEPVAANPAEQPRPEPTPRQDYGYNPNRTTGYSGPYNTQQPYGSNRQSYYGNNPQPGPNGQPQPEYQWSYDSLNSQVQPKPPKRRKGLRIFGGIVAALAVTVLSVFSIYGIYVASTGNTLDNLVPPASATEGGSSSSMPQVTINDRPAAAAGTAADGGMSNNAIFKKVSPSVVGIISYVGNDYFGNAVSEQGSGIIMSEDGFIITNAHVVQNAGQIDVVLTDGKTYPAELIGGDTQTDLAVLKVEATDLPAAEFGSSEQLEVGDRVVAIGNPGGLQFANSLTVGYVSALNRILTTGEVGYALECIQTDAAINPGNSGGALINAYGQVVGINSAKIAAENFEGMGFAIPVDEAMPIVQDLMQNRKVTGRAMLGITASEIAATDALKNRIPLGLMIKTFTEGSDLPNKGAKVGDIITHINNTPVYNTTGSADILKNYKPGDTVTITIYRIDQRGGSGSFNIDVILSAS